MARSKRKTSAPVVAGLPVIRRHGDVLEPVYEADPEGRPVVHHRTVDTLGIMLRAGTITREMHDPKSGGWPVNLAVGLGLSSRFAGGIRRAKGSGAVRAAGL